ncbi:MAG: hypothetical protein JWR59_2199 [Brevundimonas sp.]|nr:hypothetical protein [Brevundimonas sp.]
MILARVAILAAIALSGCATRPPPAEPLAVLSSFWRPDEPTCDFTQPVKLSAGFSTSAYSPPPRRATMKTYGAGQVIPLARPNERLCLVVIRWRAARDETALALLGFDVMPVDPDTVRITPAYVRLTQSALPPGRSDPTLTTRIQFRDGEQTQTLATTLPAVGLTQGRVLNGEPMILAWREAATFYSLSMAVTEWRPGSRRRRMQADRENALAINEVQRIAEAAAAVPYIAP